MADNTEDEVLEEDDIADDVEEKSEGDEATPTRKSAAYFVGLRQGKKQAKEELKKDESDEDEELTPKARSAIHKELAPVTEMLKKQSDDLEVREYLADNPDLKKHEKEIRRKMEAWPDVPVSEIAKTINVTEERAERKQKVESQVRAKRLGGTSGGAVEPKLPTTASDQQAMYDRVKKGRETIDLKQFASE